MFDYRTGTAIYHCGLRLGRTRQLRPDGANFVVLMSHPSTATSTADDQTIQRLISIAEQKGYGKLTVYNLAGPASHMEFLQQAIRDEAEVVVAWGSNNHDLCFERFCSLGYRGAVKCFGICVDGAPAMPTRRHVEQLHVW